MFNGACFFFFFCVFVVLLFFFQAEDGIRYLVRSRGLGDVYKRQDPLARRRRIAVVQRGPAVRATSHGGAPRPAVRAGAGLSLIHL